MEWEEVWEAWAVWAEVECSNSLPSLQNWPGADVASKSERFANHIPPMDISTQDLVILSL